MAGGPVKRRNEVAQGTLDQWFTPEADLDRYASIIDEHAKGYGIDTFVDSSAGTGALGLKMHALGYKVYMFDVDDQYLMEEVKSQLSSGFGFSKRDFLTTDANDVPENTVIGFNPPFGHQSSEAVKFIEHAASLHPTLMAWLTKHISVRGGRYLPSGFARVGYESSIVSFERPGKVESKQGVGLSIWHRDSAAHEAEKIEIATDLEITPPAGFKVEMAQTQWVEAGLKVEKTPFSKWPAAVRTPQSIVLQRAGVNSGCIMYIFDAGNDGPRYMRFSRKGLKIDVRTASDRISPSCFYHIVVPPRFKGDKRIKLFVAMRSTMEARRALGGQKRGVSQRDVSHALVAANQTLG